MPQGLGFRQPGDFGAALVRVWFDLEGGVGDAILVLESAAGLVEDRVDFGSVLDHEVDGGDVHLGGEGPDVEVMDVNHSRNPGQVGVQLVEVESGGCALDENPECLPSQPVLIVMTLIRALCDRVPLRLRMLSTR
jgi:hypothetical protein